MNVTQKDLRDSHTHMQHAMALLSILSRSEALSRLLISETKRFLEKGVEENSIWVHYCPDPCKVFILGVHLLDVVRVSVSREVLSPMIPNVEVGSCLIASVEVPLSCPPVSVDGESDGTP